MMAKDLLCAAQELAPKLQGPELSHLLRGFCNRGLVAPLNAHGTNCSFYFWTDRGRTWRKRAIGASTAAPPVNLCWDKLAMVMRGRMRRVVVRELARDLVYANVPATAQRIRKELLAHTPLGLRSLRRTLTELEQAGVVLCTRSQRCVYRLSPDGVAIAAYLASQAPVSNVY